MTPPDPPDVNHLSWRLEQLENHVAQGFADMRTDMRAQLTRLESTVERMAFVDQKLYQSEQAAQDRAIAAFVEAMSKRMDRSDSRQNLILTLVLGAILSAVAGYLLFLATA